VYEGTVLEYFEPINLINLFIRLPRLARHSLLFAEMSPDQVNCASFVSGLMDSK